MNNAANDNALPAALTTKKVKVAEFRNEIDHIYRLVCVDFNACANATERDRWAEITTRAVKEVLNLRCTRANARDKARHVDATERAIELLSTLVSPKLHRV